MQLVSQYAVFKVHFCAASSIQTLTANGDGEIRTLDPLLARQVLSQLSYTPIGFHLYSGPALPAYPLFFFYKGGIHLLSRAVSSKVPSAAYGLTIVFGMGTGVSHKRIDTTYFLLSEVTSFN